MQVETTQCKQVATKFTIGFYFGQISTELMH